MQYWLRRNNTEKGPFTVEALMLQGLQPTDLIKIDGASEWKPVTEYQDLLKAAQSPSKPKFKFTADKQLIEIKDSASQVHQRANKSATLTGNTAKAGGQSSQLNSNSPFHRMPSALPKKKTNVIPPESASDHGMIDHAKERARQNATQASGPAVGSSAAHNSSGQEIRARVQNLDEAPLREIRHYPTVKAVRTTTAKPQNSHFFKEFLLPIIIIGAIGAFAWWGYQQFTKPDKQLVNTVASEPAMDAANNASQDAPQSLSQEVSAIPLNNTGTTSHRDVNKDTTSKPAPAQTASKSAAETDSGEAVEKSKATAPAVTASVPPVTPSKDTQAATAVPKPATTAPPTVTTVRPSETQRSVPNVKKEPEPEAEKATTPVPEVKKVMTIADYVRLSLNQDPQPGIKNIRIQVRNTSKEDLNIAVIEVRYFDKEGKFIQGETLQTGKIDAGKATTVKVPSSKNADRISYKVSLISGDNVYLMGQ